jgi:hypothetical protein
MQNKSWKVLSKVTAVAAMTIVVVSLSALVAAQAPKGAISNKAQAGSIGPGRVVEVPSSDVSYEPTAAQIAAREQVLAAKSKHLAPALGAHTTAADVARPGGPATEVSAQQVSSEAATTFTVFKDNLINSICSGCGQSTVNEPSVANSGKTIVETSNWNIAYALNGGAGKPTWQNQDPYTLSPGYCCDTEVLYDQDRDVFVLLLLDYAGEGASTNGVTLSLAKGLTPTSWCTYKFNGGNFGEGATDTLDFAKIAISNNNLFLTWNDYPPNSGFAGSGLARLPLDAMASCAGIGYNYLIRTTEFTLALAQQPSAHDTFYWVSNWFLDGTVSGSNLRIFQWADNSGSYFWNTVGINPYPFGTAACGSPNWCGRLDPRSESVVISPAEYRGQANSAFAGDEILEVAATAGPSSFSNGNNYVVYNYFKLHSLAYIGNDQTFNTSETFAYPSCAVNEKGYVGCAMSQGLNAPGGLIVLQDNVNPTQPWGFDFVVGGISGASAWGDYTFTNPFRPGGGPFETVLWNVNGSTVQPYYIVWGRGSDANDYNRWKAK